MGLKVAQWLTCISTHGMGMCLNLLRPGFLKKKKKLGNWSFAYVSTLQCVPATVLGCNDIHTIHWVLIADWSMQNIDYV